MMTKALTLNERVESLCEMERRIALCLVDSSEKFIEAGRLLTIVHQTEMWKCGAGNRSWRHWLDSTFSMDPKLAKGMMRCSESATGWKLKQLTRDELPPVMAGVMPPDGLTTAGPRPPIIDVVERYCAASPLPVRKDRVGKRRGKSSAEPAETEFIDAEVVNTVAVDCEGTPIETDLVRTSFVARARFEQLTRDLEGLARQIRLCHLARGFELVDCLRVAEGLSKIVKTLLANRPYAVTPPGSTNPKWKARGWITKAELESVK